MSKFEQKDNRSSALAAPVSAADGSLLNRGHIFSYSLCLILNNLTTAAVIPKHLIYGIRAFKSDICNEIC